MSNRIKLTPTDFENLSGLLFVFCISILLSVGAFFERPYRVSVKDFVISPLIVHALLESLFLME